MLFCTFLLSAMDVQARRSNKNEIVNKQRARTLYENTFNNPIVSNVFDSTNNSITPTTPTTLSDTTADLAASNPITTHSDTSTSPLDLTGVFNAYGQLYQDVLFEEDIAHSRIYKMMVPSMVLIIGGLGMKGNEFHNLRNDLIPAFKNHVDDYLQYVPAAAMIIMKAAGVKGRSSWGRMLVADAFSVAIMAMAVNSIKYTVSEERPDGSSNNSFPSGHTATAFMCATMLSKEFSCVSPWIGVGGYALATATGLMRVANNRHWMSDILVGAGIGVIATELGYLFADLIFKDKGLKRKTPYMKKDPFRKPSFLGVNLALTIPIQPKDKMNKGFEVLSGSTASLEGAGFINTYLGFGGQLSASSFRIKYNTHIQGKHLERIHAYAGVYGSYPVTPWVLVGGKIAAGANYYLENVFSGENMRKKDVGFGMVSGLNLTLLLRKKFGLRFYADYEISHAALGLENRDVMQYFSCGTAASIAF